MNWLGRLIHRRGLERDLAEEIRQHLAQHEEELRAGGLDPDQARGAALRAFGNVLRVEEEGRAVWRWNRMEDLWVDLRYAARQLRSTPSFAAAAMLTLAVGIGANAAVFSVVRAVLLRPLPFPAADRLASVESLDVRGTPHPTSLSYPTFFEFRRAGVFAGIASYRDEQFTLAGQDGPRVLKGEIVSWNLFDVLGVAPALGRGFVPADEQPAARVVIIGDGVWRSQFGGDPAVVGRVVTLDGQPHVVAGVAPPGFAFPIGTRPVEIWTTLARDASSATAEPITEQRGARMLRILARLAPRDSLERAHERLDAVAAALARQYPDANGNVPRTSVVPHLQWLLGDTRAPMLVLWGAVMVVLLIACANIANMLLARTADRERELAIRLAIGGSRSRVVRQLITENLLIGVAGSALGLVVAHLVLAVLLPVAVDMMPRAREVSIDSSVVLLAMSLAVLTTAVVSLPPAFRVGRIDFSGALRASARGTTDGSDRIRGLLVIVQVALGLVLLSGASTLTAGLRHLTHRDLGFRPVHLVTFNVSLPEVRYPTPRQTAFTGQLLAQLRATPGVTAAAGALPLPLTGQRMQLSFNIPDRPTPPAGRPTANLAIVTSEFFETIGAPVLAGRTFTPDDDARHPRVIVVNQAFAARFFPGERVIGRVIEPGATSDEDPPDGTARLRRIIGVVGNVRQSPLVREPEPVYYLPYLQMPWMVPPLLVRTSGETTSVEATLRHAVAAVDSGVPVYDVRTVEGVLASGVSGPRFQALLFGGFAGIALLLVATGLYGVLTYAVLRRTREIGVRIALGASRRAILRLIGGWAATLVITGIGVGLVGAVAAQALIRRTFLETGVSATGPLAVVTCLVITTAALSACLPAARAASVEPTRSLRAE
jgi:putative ABC transport system permease protein